MGTKKQTKLAIIWLQFVLAIKQYWIEKNLVDQINKTFVLPQVDWCTTERGGRCCPTSRSSNTHVRLTRTRPIITVSSFFTFFIFWAFCNFIYLLNLMMLGFDLVYFLYLIWSFCELIFTINSFHHFWLTL